jgi:LacI family gluconate utilization system Gnt-I transcriptional repressor
VARLAGVGTTTVSRAINHPDQVAAKTLEKVNQAIARTGYVPNLLAGALASKRSLIIAAIIPSISNQVYAETIKYFTNGLRDSGYQVLLGETDYNEVQEENLVRAFLSRKPDGIFLIGTQHTTNCRRMLMAANVPIVETWDMTPTPLDLLVGFSHLQIGQAIATYLINKGFDSFGGIWSTDERAQLRKKSFLKTLEQHGIHSSCNYDAPPPSGLKKGRDGFDQLLKKGFKTGAIACSSDILAQGVIIEIQAQGLKVPQDIAVIGFADQEASAYTAPTLSTVNFDRQAIGQKAAEILLAKINGRPIDKQIIDVGFKIIERESTLTTS